MTDSTKQRRQRHVDETNAEMRAAGIEPDPEVVELQRRYVAGDVSIDDLIDWMAALIRSANHDDLRFPRPGAAH
jgi:Antitoxin VbhA